MLRFLISRYATVVLSAVVLVNGCGPKADKTAPPKGDPGKVSANGDVDPHDMPLTDAEIGKLRGDVKSYGVAVTRIKSYRDTIRDRIAADKPAEAHRSLDELDLVLEWLPGIAKDSGIAKEHWETINTAAQTLRESFNQVHSNIDEKRDPDYKSVATTIDESIDKLEKVPGANN